MKCQRCMGQVFEEEGDLVCLACGWREVEPGGRGWIDLEKVSLSELMAEGPEKAYRKQRRRRVGAGRRA